MSHIMTVRPCAINYDEYRIDRWGPGATVSGVACDAPYYNGTIDIHTIPPLPDVNCDKCKIIYDMVVEGGLEPITLFNGSICLPEGIAMMLARRLPVYGEPEYRNIDAFVQFMQDNERTGYTHVDLIKLCANERLSTGKMRELLAKSKLWLTQR